MSPTMVRGLCMGLTTTCAAAGGITIAMETTANMHFGYAFLIHWLLAMSAGGLMAVMMLPISRIICSRIQRSDN